MTLLPHMFMTLLPHMFMTLLPHMFFAAVHVYHTCWAVEIQAVVTRADVIPVVDLLMQKMKLLEKLDKSIWAVSFFVSSSFFLQKSVKEARVVI